MHGSLAAYFLSAGILYQAPAQYDVPQIRASEQPVVPFVPKDRPERTPQTDYIPPMRGYREDLEELELSLKLQENPQVKGFDRHRLRLGNQVEVSKKARNTPIRVLEK